MSFESKEKYEKIVDWLKELGYFNDYKNGTYGNAFIWCLKNGYDSVAKELF